MNPEFPPISDPRPFQPLPAKPPRVFLMNVVVWVLVLEVWLLTLAPGFLAVSNYLSFMARFPPFRGRLYADAPKVLFVSMTLLPLCFLAVVLLRHWLLTRKTGKSTYTP